LVAFLCAIACGQSPPTFTARVSLVHVDVGVTVTDGRILTGLSQGDFRVLDDGKVQVITGFLAEEQPIDLILLVDISGSMHTQVARIASAAREAFRELGTPALSAPLTVTRPLPVILGFRIRSRGR